MRYLIICFTTLLSICFSAANASPVWKVSNEDSHLFIGGTIHLLSPKDHPLPEAFSTAYKRADHVIFETDMEAMKNPTFAQKAALSMMYTDGRTLEKTLSNEAFNALSHYLAENNIPPATFMMFTPTGVMLTLTVMEYQKLGMVQEAGVDTVMHKQAKQDKKTISFLETPDEQLRFLTNMAIGDEDEMILYTLEEIHRMPTMINTMKNAWRSGDLSTLNTAYMNDLKKDFPSTYNMLIKDRNDKWLPKIERMLVDKEHQSGIELVLVGALHLTGKDGVLTQLEKKGYKIKQL